MLSMNQFLITGIPLRNDGKQITLKYLNITRLKISTAECQEANQLAIYKHGQGWGLNPGPQDFKSGGGPKPLATPPPQRQRETKLKENLYNNVTWKKLAGVRKKKALEKKQNKAEDGGVSSGVLPSS